jgi:hypothetical protein
VPVTRAARHRRQAGEWRQLRNLVIWVSLVVAYGPKRPVHLQRSPTVARRSVKAEVVKHTEKGGHLAQRAAGTPSRHPMPRVLHVAGETSQHTYGRHVGEAQLRQLQLHLHTVSKDQLSQRSSQLVKGAEVDLALDQDTHHSRSSPGRHVNPSHLAADSPRPTQRRGREPHP